MSAAYRGMPPNQMGVPPQYMGAGQMRPMAPVADPAVLHRKRVQTKVPQRGPSEDEDPSGDELDDISARDIAMARYKRNHDYLSEIFTPYSVSSVLPPQLDNSHNKEEIQKLIEEQQKLLKDTENEVEQNIKEIQDKSRSYWSLFGNLTSTSSIADMDKAKNALAESLGVKLELDPRLYHPVPVPGLQQEPELTPGGLSLYQHSPGQPHHMQQHVNNNQPQVSPANNNEPHVSKDNATAGNPVNAYQGYHVPSGQEAIDGANMSEENNDFFDEMVNTGQDDDNGSVSEYLNTADMDFEITEKDSGEAAEPSSSTNAEGQPDNSTKQ